MVFTARSIAFLAQDLFCKLLQIMALATKLLSPIMPNECSLLQLPTLHKLMIDRHEECEANKRGASLIRCEIGLRFTFFSFCWVLVCWYGTGWFCKEPYWFGQIWFSSSIPNRNLPNWLEPACSDNIGSLSNTLLSICQSLLAKDFSRLCSSSGWMHDYLLLAGYSLVSSLESSANIL